MAPLHGIMCQHGRPRVAVKHGVPSGVIPRSSHDPYRSSAEDRGCRCVMFGACLRAPHSCDQILGGWHAPAGLGRAGNTARPRVSSAAGVTVTTQHATHAVCAFIRIGASAAAHSSVTPSQSAGPCSHGTISPLPSPPCTSLPSPSLPLPCCTLHVACCGVHHSGSLTLHCGR